MHKPVIRFAGFLTLICVLSVTGADRAAAGQVNVRTGTHAGYSRLVFDWTKTVQYRIERRERTRLVIEFSAAATLPPNAAAAAAAVANISALETLSAAGPDAETG